MADLPRRPRDYAEVLRAACAFLRNAGREEARIEAELLLAHVLGVTRARLILIEVDWSAEQRAQYQQLLKECAAGTPVAYLEGSRGFYGHEFAVSPAVLIPRADSECLVESASAWLGSREAWVADLGTGSGALLLSTLLACPHARGIALDRSRAALQVARQNAQALKLQQRVHFLQADWLTALREPKFELVLCNPPYIEPSEELGPGVAEQEPHLALFTPPQQPYACYEAVLRDLPHCLGPGGRVYFEVGIGRAAGLAQRCEQTGLTVVETVRDLGGIERVVVAERPT